MVARLVFGFGSNILQYGELCSFELEIGKRKYDGQLLRFTDVLEHHVKKFRVVPSHFDFEDKRRLELGSNHVACLPTYGEQL